MKILKDDTILFSSYYNVYNDIIIITVCREAKVKNKIAAHENTHTRRRMKNKVVYARKVSGLYFYPDTSMYTVMKIEHNI